jgi:hypothetical protein
MTCHVDSKEDLTFETQKLKGKRAGGVAQVKKHFLRPGVQSPVPLYALDSQSPLLLCLKTRSWQLNFKSQKAKKK